jgi:hypothetical protein
MDWCFLCRKRDTSLNIRDREGQWGITNLDNFVIHLVTKKRQFPSDSFYSLYYFCFLIRNMVIYWEFGRILLEVKTKCNLQKTGSTKLRKCKRFREVWDDCQNILTSELWEVTMYIMRYNLLTHVELCSILSCQYEEWLIIQT